MRTLDEHGIANEDWRRVGGGDGFYARVDPAEPSTAYLESLGGNLQRLDLRSMERKNIRPEPEEESAYRFDRNSPLLLSPHDGRTVYFGGNRLFISNDRGDSWRASPDLTRGVDRDELPIMGVLPGEKTLSRHDGVASFGHIVTVSESPLEAGILYVGTDDGNLQVSRDGGKSWKNVAERVAGVPRGTYLSRVEASHSAPGRVYAAFDGHRSDDFSPYLYVNAAPPASARKSRLSSRR